jgi:hypothetical protein
MTAKGQMGLEIFPAELDTPEFRSAWDEWLADRRARRLVRYTARGQELQLQALAKLGAATAADAIHWSMAQGYQGIFPRPAAKPAQKAAPWQAQKKLELLEARLKELRGKSPGEHCDLRDWLSVSEREEYSRLLGMRKKLREEALA